MSNYMPLRIIALIIITLQSACQPVSNPGICRDSSKGPVRACTLKEQAFIDVMRGVISQIRHFDTSSFNKSFAGYTNNTKKSRVFLFGEKHTEIISQIETLGAMNALAQEGDYLLLEGSDRKNKYMHNCAILLILGIYMNWQWESKGQSYSVEGLKSKEKWSERMGFGKLLRRTIDSFDISDLNLTKLTCGFWDDQKALADTLANDVTTSNFEKRNESMVQALDIALKKARRVFIITGYLHMPSGDYFRSQLLNPNNAQFPKNLAKYYEALRKNGRGRGRFSLEVTAGTTEMIYNYLINNNIPYSELMHGKLIYP